MQLETGQRSAQQAALVVQSSCLASSGSQHAPALPRLVPLGLLRHQVGALIHAAPLGQAVLDPLGLHAHDALAPRKPAGGRTEVAPWCDPSGSH